MKSHLEQRMTLAATRLGLPKLLIIAIIVAAAIALLYNNFGFSAASTTGIFVSEITYETRPYSGSAPADTTSAISTFNGLPVGSAGYTDGPIQITTLSGINHSIITGGSFLNIGNHFQISFLAETSGTFAIRFGPDFGLGGALLLDGVVLQSRWGQDLWWAGDFANTSQTLTGSPVISAGPHVIDVYGFDGCCDGPMDAQYDFGLGWVTFQVTDTPSLFFSEPFDFPGVEPNLEDPDAAYVVSGGFIRKASSANLSDRRYVRTVLTEYISNDWTYTIDFDNSGDTGDIIFIGLGAGERAPLHVFNEPGNAVFFRIHPTNIISGQIHVAVMSTGLVFHTVENIGNLPSTKSTSFCECHSASVILRVSF